MTLFTAKDHQNNVGYKVEPSDKHAGWWMVTCNGIPMSHHMDKGTAEWLVSDPHARAFYGSPYPEAKSEVPE